MKQRIISKGLAVAVILLFLGLAIQPSIAVQPETEIEVEPKDYLFQTIIDIANNPEVKKLFKQYKYDLFEVDIDKGVYRKLLSRNPRLLFDTLFTKPSITSEYLDKCYNNGVEITNIIDEDKVLEIMENVEITDTKLFDGLNDILNNKDLAERLETIKKINKETNSNTPIWDNYPIICSIMFLILIIFFIPLVLWGTIMDIFGKESIIWTLMLPGIWILGGLTFVTFMIMRFHLDCIEYYE